MRSQLILRTREGWLFCFGNVIFLLVSFLSLLSSDFIAAQPTTASRATPGPRTHRPYPRILTNVVATVARRSTDEQPRVALEPIHEGFSKLMVNIGNTQQRRSGSNALQTMSWTHLLLITSLATMLLRFCRWFSTSLWPRLDFSDLSMTTSTSSSISSHFSSSLRLLLLLLFLSWASCCRNPNWNMTPAI